MSSVFGSLCTTINRTFFQGTYLRPFYFATAESAREQLFSDPNSSESGENQRIHDVLTDSKSKRLPVYRSAMIAGENIQITRTTERARNRSSKNEAIMLQTKPKRAAHAAKTKKATINQWVKATLNPVMGCTVRRLDRPKTNERRRNKPHARARGAALKWQDPSAASVSESFFFSKEAKS